MASLVTCYLELVPLDGFLGHLLSGAGSFPWLSSIMNWPCISVRSWACILKCVSTMHRACVPMCKHRGLGVRSSVYAQGIGRVFQL